MKVVIAKPGEPAQVSELEPGLSALQAAVGGYVDVVRGDGFDLWINDEGAINGMPMNRMSDGFVLFGVIVAAGANADGDTVGLDDATAERVVALLNGRESEDVFPVAPVLGFQDLVCIVRYP